MELNTTIYQQQGAPNYSAPQRKENHLQFSQPSASTSASTPYDTVTLSEQAKDKDAASDKADASNHLQATGLKGLTRDDVAKLTQLKARDVEVKAHEQAHLSAAGGHATGGASYTYEKGPDGHSYAVGGEVGIDVSKESNPNATIQKMQTVKRAALAPASPSSTDRQVAAQAAVKESQARQEVLKEQQEELLHVGQHSSTSQTEDRPAATSSGDISASITSLKTSIAAYEQISAM